MERNEGCVGAAVVTAAMVVVGCGGSSEPTPLETVSTSGGEEATAADDGLRTSGTLGTLPQFAVENTLQARQRKFLRCFTEAWRRNELVGGEVRFVFRVDEEGAVRWLYLGESTVGDRATERCLLDVAREATFPEPSDGEAEFTWSLAVDPMEDVRPPVAMDAERAAAEVAEDAAAALGECAPGGAAPYRVTTYVRPGGSVLAAGVASRAEAEAEVDADAPPEVDPEVLECLVEQVAEWELPDPGSYPGKVTLELR
ncbi:MAG: AgmX/PglI C-terminal domain-containing protein [Myxococcota bacterium]